MEEINTQIQNTETVVTELLTNDNVSQQIYVPSSTEKKRAVMMYLLIGIIVIAFNNKKNSNFEQFHLKQSLGWRAVFLLIIVISVVFLFIPIIRYIPIFIILIMLIILGVCVKNARDGKYIIATQNKLSIFVNLGEWIMTLFEVNKEEKIKEISQNNKDFK